MKKDVSGSEVVSPFLTGGVDVPSIAGGPSVSILLSFCRDGFRRERDEDIWSDFLAFFVESDIALLFDRGWLSSWAPVDLEGGCGNWVYLSLLPLLCRGMMYQTPR